MSKQNLLLLVAGLLALNCISTDLWGQGVVLDKIEQEMRKNAIDGKVDKATVDLNGDEKTDIIYFYASGELSCIQVFLQINGQYMKQIDKMCSYYTLKTSQTGKELKLIEQQCCGESPFTFYQTYRFNQTSAMLVENYIATNGEYTDGKMVTPASYLDRQYEVTVVNDNYNLRFSPDILPFEGSNEENFVFTCQPLTNIIATIKSNARLKVLSELPDSDGRIWLYAEVEEKDLKSRCNITVFDSSPSENRNRPAIRGWISNRYTKKCI